MADEKRTLSKDLANFELVGIEPGEIKFKGTSYDFRTMTAATAEELVKAKCPYIKAKAASKKN